MPASGICSNATLRGACIDAGHTRGVVEGQWLLVGDRGDGEKCCERYDAGYPRDAEGSPGDDPNKLASPRDKVRSYRKALRSFCPKDATMNALLRVCGGVGCRDWDDVCGGNYQSTMSTSM